MSELANRFDVAVIGAGAVGLAVAWKAAQRGLRVIVLERAEPGSGTSRVAAGMIAPIAEAQAIERALLGLSLASAAAYPRFIEELTDVSEVDPGYLPCGTLMVARDGDEAEALARELELRTRLELRARRLRASEAREMEPALAPVLRLALDIPDDRAVDPRRLTAALAEALRRCGGTLRTGVQATPIVSGGRVDGVRLEGDDQLNVEQVVVAAGSWSSMLELPREARIPVRPVKGQIMLLRDPAGPGLLTRVVRVVNGSYLVPRGDGRYVLGGTVEERGFDTTVTAGAAFELLRDAFELLPSITELVIEELSAGLRPTTPDNAPALGPGALPGLHWATGHYRHGILLTPISAEIVVAGLTGEQPGALAAPFSPARFSDAAVGV